VLHALAVRVETGEVLLGGCGPIVRNERGDTVVICLVLDADQLRVFLFQRQSAVPKRSADGATHLAAVIFLTEVVSVFEVAFMFPNWQN
jgi:hypothetical protein